METNDKDLKVTKSGLIAIGVIVFAVLIVILYFLYSAEGKVTDSMIIVLVGSSVGIGITSLLVLFIVKFARGVRKRTRIAWEKKDKKLLNKVRTLASLAWLYSVMSVMVTGQQNVIIVISGVLCMVCGFGLMLARHWGRYVFIVAGSMISLFYIFDLLFGDSLKTVSQIASEEFSAGPIPIILVIFVLIRILIVGFFIFGIYFFTRPKVKEQFR